MLMWIKRGERGLLPSLRTDWSPILLSSGPLPVVSLHCHNNPGKKKGYRVSDHHWPITQHHSEREPKSHANRKGNVHPQRNTLRFAGMDDLIGLGDERGGR